MITGSRAIELLPEGRTQARKIEDALRCGSIVVPVGYVSDGASIPRAFWSIIGHPFEGLFIRPALIHDIRCEFKLGTWQDTHAQFLETLAAEGVARWRRQAMYAAVWTFGPRWPRHEERSVADLLEIVHRPLGPNGRPWGEYFPKGR